MLRDAGAPDVDIRRGLVHLPVGENGPVGHDAHQVVPRPHLGQPAPLPPSMQGPRGVSQQAVDNQTKDR